MAPGRTRLPTQSLRGGDRPLDTPIPNTPDLLGLRATDCTGSPEGTTDRDFPSGELLHRSAPISAGIAIKSQLAELEIRTEQRTPNPGVRSSSPWRHTRSDLGLPLRVISYAPGLSWFSGRARSVLRACSAVRCWRAGRSFTVQIPRGSQPGSPRRLNGSYKPGNHPSPRPDNRNRPPGRYRR